MEAIKFLCAYLSCRHEYNQPREAGFLQMSQVVAPYTRSITICVQLGRVREPERAWAERSCLRLNMLVEELSVMSITVTSAMLYNLRKSLFTLRAFVLGAISKRLTYG